MKIVFSFDDGRADFIESSKILSKYGLVGTFHITTGFIDGSFKTDAFGIDRKPLTIQELQQMKKEGMEISSHGDKHVMTSADFIESLRKLKEWGLIDNNRVGFSIPNSKYSTEELEDFISKNKNSLLYVRGGRSPKCYSFISKVNYVFYRFLKFQGAYNSFNKYNLIDNLAGKVIYSAVITKNVKYKNLISFINKHKKEDKVLVLMFHSVVDVPNNKWEYSKTDFETICKFVSNCKEIENGTIVSLLSKN